MHSILYNNSLYKVPNISSMKLKLTILLIINFSIQVYGQVERNPNENSTLRSAHIVSILL